MSDPCPGPTGPERVLEKGSNCGRPPLARGPPPWGPRGPPRPLPTYDWILRTKICVQVKPPSHALVLARNSCSTEEVTHAPQIPHTQTHTRGDKHACTVRGQRATRTTGSCVHTVPTRTIHTEASFPKVTHTSTTHTQMPLTQPDTTAHKEAVPGQPQKCHTATHRHRHTTYRE